MNKTKVVATINQDVSKDMIKSFVASGVDCIKVDLNDASLEFCSDLISKLNEANKELKTYISLMLELKGPSIKVLDIQNDNAFLKKDDKIRIHMDNIVGDSTKFSVDTNIISDVTTGSIIKIDDGTVELKVIGKDKDNILCVVLKEGIISSGRNLNIVNTRLSTQFISEFDKQAIIFAHENNVDFISLSKVYTEEDVLSVNDMLINLGDDHIQLFSKIETEQALSCLDKIIKLSDGIIVEKGSLANEFELEKVPVLQKKILTKCHEKGVISIASTTLIRNIDSVNYSSKVLINDATGAVLDGADAIMISLDAYPVETLKILEKTIKEIELNIDYEHLMDVEIENDITNSIAYSVSMCANKLDCKAIFAPTISGYTAKKISRFKPLCPILAVSPNVKTVKSLSLNFGIYPVLISELKSFDSIIAVSKQVALEYLELSKGDNIIITGGYPFKDVKHTNFMKIEEL